MATENGSNALEEREEGEIIEDELEDVSDCSINSPLFFGKSVKSPERLRAVSLSSISDSDEDTRLAQCRTFLPFLKEKRRSRHVFKSKRVKCKCRQRYKKPTVDLSSDTEEEKLDRRTLRQLKEAVRINTSKEAHQNSLRTRLKCLIEPAYAKSNSEDEVELNKLRVDALQSQGEVQKEETENNLPGDSFVDKELTELRLEALKSAMLKKHLARKKRKLGEVKNDDKENAQSGVNESKVRKVSENEQKVTETNNTSVEEDVDIMRATLLASMSTKMVKIPEIPQTAPTKPQTKANGIPNKYKLQKTVAVQNKYFTNGKRTVNNVVPSPKLPSVAPLIINLNNDSDSDMDLESPQEEEEDRITKTVSEFLKEQRAKIEAEVNKETERPAFDKSVVKLLPLQRQKEYQMLKQRLLNAKTRPRVRKYSQKPSEPLLKKAKLAVKKSTGGDLRKTIEELQIQKDGRLQVKGKYQELAQMLKKVNQVSVERERYETEIKRLLQELDKTKNKLNASHQNFKTLVEELMRRKEAIDESFEANKAFATSTPLKVAAKERGMLDESVIEPAKCVVEPILDPNDITEVFVKRPVVETKAPKYESPLDRRNGSALVHDPLATYCPYELLGVCKDKECTYKHCS